MIVFNDCICHFVVRAMVSAEAAFSIRENFERYIVEGLRKKGKNVRFVFPPTAINCNDMFREFLLDHSAIGDVVANEVIRQVDEVLNNEQIMSQSGAVTFESKYTTNYSSDYMFIFRINAKKRVIIFEEFVSVTSDEEHKRIPRIPSQQKCDFLIHCQKVSQTCFVELKGENISVKSDYNPYDQVIDTVKFLRNEEELKGIVAGNIEKHAFIVSPECTPGSDPIKKLFSHV